MKRGLTLVLVILLMGSLMLQAESLEDVLKKNYEARGGLTKLKAIKAVSITGKANRMGTEFPMKMTVKMPDKMYMEAEFMGNKVIQAYDGKTAWQVMPMMGINEPTPMPEEQAKNIVDQAEGFDPLVTYKEMGNKLELMGKEDMEGTEVYKLKLTRKKSKKEVFFYLDTESGIELKATQYQKSEAGETLIETLFSEYKEVDGVMMPFQLETKAGGNSIMTIVIDSYKMNEKIDDALFAMPEKKAEKKAEKK